MCNCLLLYQKDVARIQCAMHCLCFVCTNRQRKSSAIKQHCSICDMCHTCMLGSCSLFAIFQFLLNFYSFFFVTARSLSLCEYDLEFFSRAYLSHRCWFWIWIVEGECLVWSLSWKKKHEKLRFTKEWFIEYWAVSACVCVCFFLFVTAIYSVFFSHSVFFVRLYSFGVRSYEVTIFIWFVLFCLYMHFLSTHESWNSHDNTSFLLNKRKHFGSFFFGR